MSGRKEINREALKRWRKVGLRRKRQDKVFTLVSKFNWKTTWNSCKFLKTMTTHLSLMPWGYMCLIITMSLNVTFFQMFSIPFMINRFFQSSGRFCGISCYALSSAWSIFSWDSHLLKSQTFISPKSNSTSSLTAPLIPPAERFCHSSPPYLLSFTEDIISDSKILQYY